VPADLHGNILGDASQTEIPDRAAAKVMDEQPFIMATRAILRHLAESKSTTGILPGGSEAADIKDRSVRLVSLTEHINQRLWQGQRYRLLVLTPIGD
jgi:hypothetical protein